MLTDRDTGSAPVAPDPAARIVTADGAPARRRLETCAECGADRRTQRIDAAGFGPPVFVCRTCGAAWPD